MNFTGLSLDQAPPFNAPLRFFLTAPLFGAAAAMGLVLTEPALLESRYAPELIGIVHLLTIGFFAMVMLGALQQMLPVLAGVSLPRAVGVAAVSHAALTLGTLCMAAGIYLGSSPFMLAAALLLGIGMFVLLGAIILAMKRVTFFTPTVRAMIVAVAMAVLTVLVGLHLLGSHATGHFGASHVAMADIHALLGIFGFAGILIVGVSFQVLPMFYVTQAYETRFANLLPVIFVAALVGWAAGNLSDGGFAVVAKAAVALLFALFALSIVGKLRSRKRPIRDVTVWYWYLGAVLLVAGNMVWIGGDFADADTSIPAGILVGGFIAAVITGMLYKIVPFLAWFHLNASGYMTIPTMKEMIHEKTAKAQLASFAAAVLLLLGAYFGVLSVSVGGTVLAASMILLEINLFGVLRTYRNIRKNPPEFSFEMPAN